MNDMHLKSLITAYAQSGSPDSLEKYLQDESRLPGPRANLSLAEETADLLPIACPADRLIPLLERFAAVGPDVVGTNEPGVFLPFIAAQTAGVVLPTATHADRLVLLNLLRSAANDPRWRVREGAAIGLQRTGDADIDLMLSVLQEWSKNATLYELRAIVATVAEPRLLADSTTVASAWALADLAMTRLHEVEPANRRADDFIALRKGLGYGLSVIVAAEPDSGFTHLATWARVSDRDIAWVVKENLKKNRLRSKHPSEVAAVSALPG